jgi:acyl carrier protein
MGLEAVELVLEIEDRFGISLPDDVASDTETVAQLIEVVAARVQQEEVGRCWTNHSFYKLRRELLKILALSPRKIRPSSQIKALIPRRQRRATLRQLSRAGINPPPLGLSSTAQFIVLGSTTIPFVLWTVWLGSRWPLLGVVPSLIVAYGLTRPLAVHAREFNTVGGMAQYLASKVLESNADIALSRSQIAAKVRAVVAEQLQVCVEDLDDETRFLDLYNWS